jgi:hypothetical protein
VGRNVGGRGGRGLDAVRAETKKQGVNVARVGEGHRALLTVVGEGEAQELSGDGMRLYLVEARQRRDKKVEVVAILVFNTEIVNDYDEGYRTG